MFFLYSLLLTLFYFCYFSDCREACVVFVVTRLRRRLVTEIVSTCIEKSNEEKCDLCIAVFKYLLVSVLTSIDMLANLFVVIVLKFIEVLGDKIVL